MQTNFFSSFFSATAQSVAQATVDASPRFSAPVELDLATLEHVGGGKGPAGTWSADAVAEGPAGTW